MPSVQKNTFGDFFDELKRMIDSNNIEAQGFLERFINPFSPKEWQRLKGVSLTSELILEFVNNVRRMVFVRLCDILNNDFYDEAKRMAFDFLGQINEAAKKFDIDIEVKTLKEPFNPID